MGTSIPAPGPGAAGRPGVFRVLDIPADPGRSCFLLTVTADAGPDGHARSIHHLEAVYWGTIDGVGYRVYLPRGRGRHDRFNERLALLGSRLGWPALPDRAFTGGALITGTGPGNADADVPAGILAAALRAHLLPRPRQPHDGEPARPGRLPEPSPAEPGAVLVMEVVTLGGRATPVDFLITGDVVEIWHHEGAAVVDRAVLRAWLADPPGTPLVLGSAIFCLERGARPEGQVALTLPDVGVWIVPPRLLVQLRSQV